MIKNIFFAVLFSAQIFATNYYINKNASGANNGTSWSDAWQTFAAITWAPMGGGDTLFISGGAYGDTVKYTENLSVPSSASGNSMTDLFVIRAGLDAGHNGTVLIERGTGDAINITGATQYVRIEKISIDKCNSGVKISYGTPATKGIFLDSLTVTNTSYQVEGCGIFFHNNDQNWGHLDTSYVRWCYVSSRDTNAAGLNIQRDCGCNNTAENITWYKNIMVCYTHTNNQHSDVMQINYGKNISFIGNLFVHYINDYRTSDNLHKLMQLDNPSGTLLFYNNVIYEPFAWGNTNKIILEDKHAYRNTRLIFVGNSVISWHSGENINFSTDDTSGNFLVANNLFMATNPNPDSLATLSFGDSNYVYGSHASRYWDYNAASEGIGFRLRWGAVGQANSWNTVNSLFGFMANANRAKLDSIPSDSLLQTLTYSHIGNNFRPQINSRIRNEGIDLSDSVIVWNARFPYAEVLWEDFYGAARDATPDIGAAEYEAATPPAESDGNAIYLNGNLAIDKNGTIIFTK